MSRFLCMLLVLHLAMAPSAHSQTPTGWRLRPSPDGPYTAVLDTVQSNGGRSSLRLSAPDSLNPDAAWVQQVLAVGAMRGQRVVLSGYLRTAGAAAAGLWLRVEGTRDGRATLLGFDSMGERMLTGATAWTPAYTVLDVPQDAEYITYGVLMVGSGAVWGDELQFDLAPPELRDTNVLLGPVIHDAAWLAENGDERRLMYPPGGGYNMTFDE